MPRPELPEEEKKVKLTITVDKAVFDKLAKKSNRSNYVNVLLKSELGL